jgi:hypothetical protein
MANGLSSGKHHEDTLICSIQQLECKFRLDQCEAKSEYNTSFTVRSPRVMV